MSFQRLGRAVPLVLALSLSPARGEAPIGPLNADGCALEPGPVLNVARVLDSETLALDDGTEVRLIGALAPRPLFSARPWRIEETAKAALEDLVAGRAVALGYSGPRANRHGQRLAHVFAARGGDWVWVQGDLLERGLARAYGLPGAFGCAAELLARERVARNTRAGLWSLTAFGVASAGAARDLLRLPGAFQIVRGEIRKVERVKKRLYINFGDDWRTDFTAGASLGTGNLTPRWAQKMEALAGWQVEARGWVERRYGPFIEIWDPSQIEIIDRGAVSDGGEARPPETGAAEKPGR